MAKKKRGYLKKQTQFTKGQIGVKYYLKGYYGKITLFWAQKNKAKQSQFLLAPSTAVGLKRNLKKQSQFSKGQIGVISYMKGSYNNITPYGQLKTNPIQSQSVSKE